MELLTLSHLYSACKEMLTKVVNEVKATTFRYYSTRTIHYTSIVQYQYISGSDYGSRQPEQAARE